MRERRITKPQMALLRQVVRTNSPIMFCRGLFKNKDCATLDGARANLQTVRALIWRGLIRSRGGLLVSSMGDTLSLDTKGYVCGDYHPTRYGHEVAQRQEAPTRTDERAQEEEGGR